MKLIKYILYPFIIIVVLVICLSPSLGNNIFDRYHWVQKKSQLESIELSKVTFYTGGNNAKNVELTGTEKDNFMNSLLSSDKGNLFSIKNKELEQVLLKYNIVL